MSTSTTTPTDELTVGPIPRTPQNLPRRGALWDAIEETANQLHPDRPIPNAQLYKQQDWIAQHGESQAAWDTYVLSGLLADAQALAVDEGLIGLRSPWSTRCGC